MVLSNNGRPIHDEVQGYDSETIDYGIPEEVSSVFDTVMGSAAEVLEGESADPKSRRVDEVYGQTVNPNIADDPKVVEGRYD